MSRLDAPGSASSAMEARTTVVSLPLNLNSSTTSSIISTSWATHAFGASGASSGGTPRDDGIENRCRTAISVWPMPTANGRFKSFIVTLTAATNRSSNDSTLSSTSGGGPVPSLLLSGR